MANLRLNKQPKKGRCNKVILGCSGINIISVCKNRNIKVSENSAIMTISF